MYDLCSFSRAAHLEKQELQQAKEKLKPKVKRHLTSKSDEPDLQESAFLKKIIAYQRKLLVQHKEFLSFSYTIGLVCVLAAALYRKVAVMKSSKK